MIADDVCGAARVRSSQMPASGWSCSSSARSPSHSILRKSSIAGRTQQPVIEECLRRCEYRVAVHVVLVMLVRLVADAHRTHAAIAGKAT